MFTGIIEALGSVVLLKEEKNNLHITVLSPISSQLKIDQSVSHNGVCLTVVETKDDTHTVTAVFETLLKSNLQHLKIGDKINLERCMQIGDRLDGHMVQGHVDTTVEVIHCLEQNGSHVLTFSFDERFKNYVVEKGSISINGISLTLINVDGNMFSAAIIPYTMHNTNFSALQPGDIVNIEFDIIGKYIEKMLSSRMV
ncbi:MAG: riboflavin synthase [Chitinophagales bacterium]|nr:riboflavin synthase [Chitinophagales bacterium]